MVRIAKAPQPKWQYLLAMVPGLLLFAAAASAWGQAGALDTTYQPSPNYVVSAVTIQPDGKALIGGAFRTVNGIERRALVRLNTNGTVDTNFVPAEIDGEVGSMAFQPDGKILVGGQFSRVGDLLTAQVARLETNGAVDKTFNSKLVSYSRFRTMALQRDGKVLVISEDLDRLMPDGSLDTNFQRLASYQWITNDDSIISAHNALNCVAELSDGKILVGGFIQALNGQAVGAGLIRLNADGAWDANFTSLTNEGVSVMIVQPDDRVVVGRNGRLARVNSDGAVDGTFASSSIEGDVMALTRQGDGKILMGGYYQRAAGLLRPGIARFNVDGTLDRNFDAGDVSGFTVTSIAVQADTKILMGGYFTRVNGQNRPYVARLHNDNPAYPGRFEFLSVSNAVPEAAGNMVIPVLRYAGSAGSVSVVVTATGWGSAFPGQDYLSGAQTLVFLPGQTSNFFTVPIINDAFVEGPYAWEAFEVNLSTPTGGASLGTESRAVGHILEDDTAIGFASGGTSAAEADGQAIIELVRLGMTNLAVGVSFQTVNGTARAPDDFTAQSGTVTFAAGETNKTIIVLLNDDALVEGDETFGMRLSAPTGGASLANTNATVYVTDDVSFMAFDGSPRVTETDGVAALKIRRWGRTNNTVSAHFATSNLTALAGSDYQATAVTLTLLPGEIEGTVAVPIIDDVAVEDLEQFQVTLTQPGGTLVLWPYGTAATVSVISDDGAGYPDTHFRPSMPGGRANQLVLAPGGEILARGQRVLTNSSLVPTLVRFQPDGSMDPTFQPDLSDDVYLIAAAADGRVYVCTGYGINTGVRRLLADGEADRTFDPFYVDYIASPPPILAMAVQADGKLIVSAYPAPYYGYETTTNFLNRLNVDGTYDLAFGPVSQLGNETLASPPAALALQPDGKLLLAARLAANNGSSRVTVLRLTDAGQFDPTFSSPQINGGVRGIRLLTSGKVMIYGTFTEINGTLRPGLAVLQSNGVLDPSFIPALRPGESYHVGLTAVAVQGDGKVIFSGEVPLLGGPLIRLGRLNVDGSLDASFHATLGSSVYIFGLELQADGKLLTAGSGGPFFDAGLERLNNDPQVGAGFLEFSSASSMVDETDASLTVTVRRSGGTNGLVRVPYATIGGAATAGTDFVTTTGVIDFAAGELGEKTITIALLDDLLAEGNESFLVSLGLPLGSATWGENAASSITLRENDTVIQFLERRLRVRENRGTHILNVERLGRTTGAVSVDYATSDVTAQAGKDYASRAGTLSFGDGETNQQVVVIIYDNQLSEIERTLALTLSHPSPGVMLGTNVTAEVTVVDNDRPGTVDESFNPGTGVCPNSWSHGVVQAIARQADGRILVGGDFREFNGVPCPGLVRLMPGGAVDPSFTATFLSGFYRPRVKRLVLQADGKVLSVVGGTGADFLVRLNANGSLDSDFGSAVAEPGEIEGLLLQADGGVLVAGRFDTLKGVGRTNLARINPDGSVAAALPVHLTVAGEPGWITAMASDAGEKLLIGGTFDTVNGVTRHNLARVDTNGVLDINFAAPGFTNALSDVLGVNLRTLVIQADGKAVVGGSVWQFDGEVLPILARLNLNGSRDTTFSVALSNSFYGPVPQVTVMLWQPDNRLLIAGQFTHVNGIFRRNLARLHADGSLDPSFQSGEIETEFYDSALDDLVHALVLQPDGQLLVGGEFSELDGQTSCGIARLNGIKLCVEPLVWNGNGPWQIRFTGTTGAHYSVLASSDLIQWTLIGVAVETTPGTFAITDPDSVLQPRRFYQLRQP